MHIINLMNKKVVITGVVVVLLLIAGFLVMKGRSNPVVTPTTTQEQNTSPTSLKDLISKGIAQSCTYSNESSTGTIYVSGGKVRGDFDTTIEGKVTKSHMIVDGSNSYIWSDGSKDGIKMTFDASATPAANATSSPVGGFDSAANMNYKCGVWSADPSVFTLPAGVTFMSFGNIPGSSPAAGKPGTTDTSSQCSYCDSLTGDSKSQCLTALKCN